MSQPKVAIFRKRLLSYSETFIADQGRFMPNVKAVYCGFSRDSSGLPMIDSMPRILLDEHSRFSHLAKLLFRSGLGGGLRWLKALKQASPSLLHAHFFSDGIDGVRLGSQLGIPVVTTVHGHDLTKYKNANAHYPKHQRFFERVDRVIAVSNFMARQALERGCPETKLVQHYIGIDLQRFTLEKQESAHPSLLFVGRLVEKKGCTYLLQAMERLKSRFSDLELTIVGDGPLKSSLQQEALARDLRVEFVGIESPDQIRARLARSWLFVAPSITANSGDAEGLGMVFLEAQALLTPVVSFRSGGVVEAVADQETGLLCEEKDVAALADNIAQLLDNAIQRRDMGDQGRQRVERHFDIRKQCALLETIYGELN